jgi:hypothetical protein
MKKEQLPGTAKRISERYRKKPGNWLGIKNTKQ